MINKFKALDKVGLISYLSKSVLAIRKFFATKSEMDVVATALTDLDRRKIEASDVPTYSIATSNTLGLVKIGYTANGKNYPVQLKEGQMYVNVPWTDTKRDITDSYNGTDSTISLSQKGGNDIYNVLVNGYASSAGNADYATSATTASKLGTASVGSGTQHFYLNTGTATASTSTVGGTAKPMYLKEGIMTAISDNIGSTSLPVYLNAGTITACTSSFVFSDLSNSENDLSITVAGQNRTLTVAYAEKAGNVEWDNVTNKPTSFPANGGNADTLDEHPASDFVLKSEHAGDMYETDDNDYIVVNGNKMPDYCAANLDWAYLNPAYTGYTFASRIQVPIPSIKAMNIYADCIKQVHDVTLVITLDNIGERLYTWKELHWLLRCSNKDCVVYTTKYATPHGFFPSVVLKKQLTYNVVMPPNTTDISVSYAITSTGQKSRSVQIVIENMYGRAHYTSNSFRDS